jgi:hypothetical protein
VPSVAAALGLAVTGLYALPLVFSRYFPGLDLPFHAAALGAIHLHDDAAVARELGGFVAVESGAASYRLLYWLADGAAYVTGDVVWALEVVLFAYVVAFAWAARRFACAFAVHPALAWLALPAAYSVVMAYGFLAYAITYPMSLAVWALVRELFLVPAPSARRVRVTLAGVAGVTALASLAHPFAGAVTLLGAGVLLLAHVERGTLGRAAALAIALAAGVLPAVLAVRDVGDAAAGLPALVREASLWDRFWAPPRVPLAEALGEAPARLLGVAAAPLRTPLFFALVIAGAVVVWAAGRQAREAGPWRRGHAVSLLFLALFLLYLVLPYEMEAPYFVAIQPRLVPLVWVVGLVALRARPDARRPRLALAAPALAVAAAAVAVALSLGRFAAECVDFDRVAAAARPRARTLALIEQPPTRDNQPASPWRHFGAYLVADRGGYVSHLPLGEGAAGMGRMGAWLPVRRAPGAPRLPAPPPGEPRTFSWDDHAAAWDQILIRDADPTRPFDYFAGHADDVELLARAGRWRLYSRQVRAVGP